MANHTVVIEPCKPEAPDERVSAKVVGMLAKLPGIDQRLKGAKRVFVKLNTGISAAPSYLGRRFDCVDSAVFAGLAAFIRERTDAQVLVGDGCDGIDPAEAARERGHMAVIEQYGFQFLDLHKPPYARFTIPDPAMFRWYELSSALQEVDLFVSLAKMKSHGTCGVTLTMKNLFGLPPGPIYGSPRGVLHSAIRLPGILADLTRRFAPEICLIDGIVGCNYWEWHHRGDPVASSALIAGDNAVATDATGARYMGVDPEAPRGTPPFLRANNHIQLASSLGLGPVKEADIDLIGEMPSERKPFSIRGAAEPETFPQAERQRAEVCRLAQWYFNERDRFVRDYAGEAVVLGKDRVLLHGPIDEISSLTFFRAIRAEGLGMYDVFCKLVQTEEAEVRAPYALGSQG